MNSAELRGSPSQRSRFAIEIAVVLGVKAALLFWLWAAFFSHPAGTQLTERRVAADLFGPAAVVNAPTPSSQREAAHGSGP